MTRLKITAFATTALCAIAVLMPMPSFAQTADDIQKYGAMPDSGTMDRADSDMKDVLEQFQKLNPKPIETLTPAEARKQPTPADAVAALLTAQGKDPAQLKADLKVNTKDLSYPAGKGTQQARVYIPEDAGKDPLPVIVYYHGGGFVIANLDVYDSAPRALAHKAQAIVVSIEYRHAPENKFPAAHEDAFAGYKWVLKNAASWGGDPQRVAVMGESAGGNLAANVAIMARDQHVQAPVHMVLVYPVAGNDMNTPSYQENANAKPLNKAMMAWFVKNTIRSSKDKDDPRINLLGADLKGLPSATVITAEIDPLMSEGKALADKLQAAGGTVDYKNYEGVTHEFFGMDAVVSDAADAQKLAVGDLGDAFDKAEDAEKKNQ